MKTSPPGEGNFQMVDESIDARMNRTVLDAPPAFPSDAKFSPFTAPRHGHLILAFMLIGVLARCVRYFLRFPLWEDECFLCVNFIGRSYGDLLQPLDYCQIAPILFLWIELTMVKLFGFNELSLRLFAFVCSIASLFVFRHVAARLLKGTAQWVAVGVFAVSYPGIRYAAEAKQYGSDMLVGLVLLALAVEWWTSADSTRRLRYQWILTAFTPLAVGLSLPAVFACGGVSAFLAFVLFQQSNQRLQQSQPHSGFGLRNLGAVARTVIRDGDWIAWGIFNVALLGSFGLMLKLFSRDHNVADMDHYWNYVFPPISAPWRLPMWFLNVHTGDLLAYPIGGSRGASSLTFVAVCCAVVSLWKGRRRTMLVLLLASPMLHLVASALQRYPYGGHVKFSQHMAGIICLLCGIGAAAIFSWLAKYQHAGRRFAAAAIVYLVVIGAASMGRDVMRPYKTQSDMRARAFAEWFWFNAGFDSEVVCTHADLGQNFCPDMYRKLSWAAMYRCNKQIYSPRKGDVDGRLAEITETHPLRCVVYRDPTFEFDQTAFDRWMNQMTARYQLVGTETFAFPRFSKGETKVCRIDYLDEYKFVPKEAAVGDSVVGDSAVGSISQVTSRQ
jgi:Dolichyl-phosphate-mannose-protein mannosyltransferase